jgi:hypothetical protein
MGEKKTLDDLKVKFLDDEVVDREVALLDSLKGNSLIEKSVNEAKKEIFNQAPDAPEQGVFSFLPTTLTRISPFFPLSKRDKNRTLPPEGLCFESSWGKMTIKGDKLSIHDETVLLAVLSLLKKHQNETFKTTKHEICKMMGVTPGKNTYQGVWGSLDRLTGAKISLEIWEPKSKKKKTKRRMTNTILAGAVEEENTGKLLITINPYFLRMYAESLVTGIDMKFRAKLKGDVTKSLYRFFRSQQGMNYECHLLTLCKAINLDVTMPLHRLRTRIKNAFRELKKAGYLKNSMVMKNDIIRVWKSPKIGGCTIEGTKR